MARDVEKINEKKKMLVNKYEKTSRDDNFVKELMSIENELDNLEKKFRNAIGNFQSMSSIEVIIR